LRGGRRWFITPALHLWYGRPGDLRVLNEIIEQKFRYTTVALTLGFTFQ
jgi:hypothetical protein